LVSLTKVCAPGFHSGEFGVFVGRVVYEGDAATDPAGARPPNDSDRAKPMIAVTSAAAATTKANSAIHENRGRRGSRCPSHGCIKRISGPCGFIYSA
jgi:hypothetical protein